MSPWYHIILYDDTGRNLKDKTNFKIISLSTYQLIWVEDRQWKNKRLPCVRQPYANEYLSAARVQDSEARENLMTVL